MLNFIEVVAEKSLSVIADWLESNGYQEEDLEEVSSEYEFHTMEDNEVVTFYLCPFGYQDSVLFELQCNDAVNNEWTLSVKE